MRKALALFACALALAACSSGSPRHAASSTPVMPSTHAPRPTPCDKGARAFWLPGPHGVRLEANAYGSGRTAAVFLHEAGGTGMCGFWPYAKWLADRDHVLVILVSRCGYGVSLCPHDEVGDRGIIDQTQPAVDWARTHGAGRVTLVGGSSGASDALQAGGVVRHVAAVVDLSGDITDTGADDPPDARRLHVPVLFVVAPQDPLSPVATARRLYRATPAHPKRLLVVTDPRFATAHGWDLLQDPQTEKFTPVAALVADWVLGHYR